MSFEVPVHLWPGCVSRKERKWVHWKDDPLIHKPMFIMWRRGRSTGPYNENESPLGTFPLKLRTLVLSFLIEYTILTGSRESFLDERLTSFSLTYGWARSVRGRKRGVSFVTNDLTRSRTVVAEGHSSRDKILTGNSVPVTEWGY